MLRHDRWLWSVREIRRLAYPQCLVRLATEACRACVPGRAARKAPGACPVPRLAGSHVTATGVEVRCLYPPAGGSAAGIALAGLAFLPPVGVLVSPGL